MQYYIYWCIYYGAGTVDVVPLFCRFLAMLWKDLHASLGKWMHMCTPHSTLPHPPNHTTHRFSPPSGVSSILEPWTLSHLLHQLHLWSKWHRVLQYRGVSGHHSAAVHWRWSEVHAYILLDLCVRACACVLLPSFKYKESMGLCGSKSCRVASIIIDFWWFLATTEFFLYVH